MYIDLVDMISTLNLGAFNEINLFVVCMQLEYQGTKRSGYIIYRTCDEHRLEQV